MIGLFEEHGPCRINNASTGVSLNPESWNNVANMLYIDQPVGVGFSHGTESVYTSEEAAADVYTVGSHLAGRCVQSDTSP
jgi:carboxypeptidase C (cathepsin A)